jgi:hypothetical protein
MTRTLLVTAAALMLTAASITTASAAPRGGGASHAGSPGGFSRGGMPSGGFARSAPSFSGPSFRSSAPSFRASAPSFRGPAQIAAPQFRGGNVQAFRGPVPGGNQFRGVVPGNRIAGIRQFRGGRPIVRLGAPGFYSDYGYPDGYYDDSYLNEDSCYQTQQVWTRTGWRYVPVYVCDE